MKKIFISMMAVAALAACTKSEVQYEPSGEIGFQVVTGKMTKAAVTGTTYPTGLNMYVFAETNDGAGLANYLNNAEFTYNQVATNDENNQIDDAGAKNLWAGTPTPYYWPNEKTLFFAGVSKSGNVNNGATPAYSEGAITIDGYVAAPGTTAQGDNDLMWFPKTGESYGKGTKYVPVDMKHACSWITVKLGGDAYTSSKYTVTDIHIEGLTTKGKVVLDDEAAWTLSTATDDTNQEFLIFNEEKALPATATADGFEKVVNNTIVLPNQVPGTLSITYKYNTQANIEISETVTASLKFDGEKPWEAGTHYTYTVLITSSQILIQPDVTEWTETPEKEITAE